jgi:tRNA (cmo5U34)-methyltransferase
MGESLKPFSDPQEVARYAERPPRIVPGFGDMQRMTAVLLAERVPEDGRVLVVGAGGGLELKVFAERFPNWNFDGIDPSNEMLRLAEQTLGQLASRVSLHQGYIDAAPPGPFDGATCLLTFHFVAFEERQRMLAEVRRRLKPGAPFIVAHLSFPQSNGERALWLSRYSAFAATSGIIFDKARIDHAIVDKHLRILTPEQDQALLRDAGFSDIQLFYTGFAFRGWVAYG